MRLIEDLIVFTSLTNFIMDTKSYLFELSDLSEALIVFRPLVISLFEMSVLLSGNFISFNVFW